MDDIHFFLAHAITLERESARRYEELAEAMRTLGSREVAEFFGRMAHYSRRHLADATARGGFHHPPELQPNDLRWPDGVSPEAAAWTGVDAFMDAASALRLALDGERRGHAFYAGIAATTRNPRVQTLAQEFAAEEAGHVQELESMLSRQAA